MMTMTTRSSINVNAFVFIKNIISSEKYIATFIPFRLKKNPF